MSIHSDGGLAGDDKGWNRTEVLFSPSQSPFLLSSPVMKTAKDYRGLTLALHIYIYLFFS